MAVKNHALDEQIITAARSEFLTCGFEKASLRKIAANADVTVGAIYTRWPTKDRLFCALVEPLVARIGAVFSSLLAEYSPEAPQYTPEHMAHSMHMESQYILDLLFEDYDRAVLLLCRSTGSSLESFFDQVVERKIRETLVFFEHTGSPHPSPAVLKLLITAQFQMYAQILSEGCGIDEARETLNAAMVYHTGGWMALLSRKEYMGGQQ